MDYHIWLIIYEASYLARLRKTGVTGITWNPKLIRMVMVDPPPNCEDVVIWNFHRRESPMVFCISHYS